MLKLLVLFLLKLKPHFRDTINYSSILTLLIISLFLFNSCNTTEPEDIKPGRRDYTWTVDTLIPPPPNTSEQFAISNIWGSSPNDMWAVCSGSSTQILLWRYDGNKWYLYPQQLGRDLWGIYGFAQNNVWIGDAENSIWHFNGSNWSKAKSLTLPGFDRVEVNYLWGISPTNIYAVGFADQFNGGPDYKAVLLNYNGSDWNFVNIPDIRAGFYQITHNKSSGEMIIYGFNADLGFIDKLFVYNGSTIREIYSDYKQPILEEMDGEVYVTVERKIYKYNNGKLNLWKDFPGTSFFAFKSGRSEKDFFGVSIEGLLHYNGTDLKAIFNTYPKQIGLYRVFVFEKDIFITATEENTGLRFIIRGTLK